MLSTIPAKPLLGQVRIREKKKTLSFTKILLTARPNAIRIPYQMLRYFSAWLFRRDRADGHSLMYGQCWIGSASSHYICSVTMSHLFPSATREGGRAVRGEADRSRGRRGRRAGDRPLGSERGGAEPHPDPPARSYPPGQLQHTRDTHGADFNWKKKMVH